MKGAYTRSAAICLSLLAATVPVRALSIPDLSGTNLSSMRGHATGHTSGEDIHHLNNHKYASVFDSTYANANDTTPWKMDTPFTHAWFYSFFTVSGCQVQSGDVNYDLIMPNNYPETCKPTLMQGMVNGFHCMNKHRKRRGQKQFKFVAVVGGEKYRENLVRCLSSAFGIEELANSAKDFVKLHNFDAIEFYVPRLNSDLVEHLGLLFQRLKMLGVKTSLQAQWDAEMIPKLERVVRYLDLFRPRFFEFTYAYNQTAPVSAYTGGAQSGSMEKFFEAIEKMGIPKRKVYATLPSHGMKWDGVESNELYSLASGGWARPINQLYRTGSEPFKYLFKDEYDAFQDRSFDIPALSDYWYNDATKQMVTFEGYLAMLHKAAILAHKYGYKAVVLNQPIDDYRFILQRACIKGLYLGGHSLSQDADKDADYVQTMKKIPDDDEEAAKSVDQFYQEMREKLTDEAEEF